MGTALHQACPDYDKKWKLNWKFYHMKIDVRWPYALPPYLMLLAGRIIA